MSYTEYLRTKLAASQRVIKTNKGKLAVQCVDPVLYPPTPGNWGYASASSITNSKVSCPKERGDSVSDVKFVDNTISLRSGHPRIVATDGCCEHKIEDPNHTHSSGIQTSVDNQRYSLGKHFFMASPPLPQGDKVSYTKIGGYVGHRSPYIENKRGYVQPSAPIPVASGGQGQDIPQLKINKPTLANIKAY
jgi:hypothetical protein